MTEFQKKLPPRAQRASSTSKRISKQWPKKDEERFTSWGALAKSDEASACKRYAPAAQREKMSKYRAWFHERRRPPRA